MTTNLPTTLSYLVDSTLRRSLPTLLRDAGLESQAEEIYLLPALLTTDAAAQGESLSFAAAMAALSISGRASFAAGEARAAQRSTGADDHAAGEAKSRAVVAHMAADRASRAALAARAAVKALLAGDQREVTYQCALVARYADTTDWATCA